MVGGCFHLWLRMVGRCLAALPACRTMLRHSGKPCPRRTYQSDLPGDVLLLSGPPPSSLLCRQVAHCVRHLALPVPDQVQPVRPRPQVRACLLLALLACRNCGGGGRAFRRMLDCIACPCVPWQPTTCSHHRSPCTAAWFLSAPIAGSRCTSRWSSSATSCWTSWSSSRWAETGVLDVCAGTHECCAVVVAAARRPGHMRLWRACISPPTWPASRAAPSSPHVRAARPHRCAAGARQHCGAHPLLLQEDGH